MDTQALQLGTPGMFCGNCGSKTVESNRFCGSCGQERRSPSLSETAAPVPEEPVPPAQTMTTNETSAPPLQVDNSFAWALAVAPLIMVLLDGVIAGAGVGQLAGVSVIAALGLNIALAAADARRIKATGATVPAMWAVFLVPAYLFVRQARLRQNFSLPIIWCVTFLVSLGGAGIIASTVGVQMDVQAVEASITSGYLSQQSLTVTVECPSSVSARIGSSFQCMVKDTSGAGATIVDVTVQNSAGDIVWLSR